SAGSPTSATVDVFFLADSTGSMGSVIGSVQSAASSILSSVSGLGNVAFGVGDYKDYNSGDPYVYHQGTNLTTTAATATTAIGAWSASGGGDYPEAGFYALQQVADTTTWRTGSTRLVVWFGDAPSQDPAGPTGITQAQAIAALNAQGIAVLAINVGTSNDFYAPTGAGHTGLNDLDQASAVASGTGGAFYDGINASTIVTAITNAITTSFATYSTVGLDVSEAPAGVTVSYSPASYTGAFDRKVDGTFGFTVTFTGVTAGTYDFNIYGTVDGGRIATEADHIVVGVPDGGSSLLLVGLALSGLALIRRKMARTVA
ncbi:MAG TPA: VPDSG-CTERM sorting domain-containing protein, partial [Opitutaceae bacterium]|nr:VPDSG-CTERM sorting domain-containing protein [Opitutaceae bacterium]